MSNYIYLVQMDIPSELEEDFNRIYDTEHIPNTVSYTHLTLPTSDLV